MANVIKLKNSGTANSAPTSLEVGELAINYADGKIFYKNSSNTIVEFGGSGGSNGITVTDTLPASPTPGDLWFESDTGKTFVYYDSYWVEIGSGSSDINDYVLGLVAGNGIIVTNNSGSAATPAIAIDTSIVQTRVANVSDTEIGYLDGVSSAIQTQIDTKSPSASPTFTGNVSLPSTTSIGNVSSTEIGYVDGVTSAIQTQIDTKAPLASPTFTGTVTVSNDLSVSGNVTVSGTTTTINTETVTINDNIIVLNNNASGSPTENAGIEVERGTSTNVVLRWNESTDRWQFTNDGTNYTDLGAGGATISETAPGFPEPGALWFKSDTAQTFVYYDSQWVEVGASAMGATVSTTAPNSPIGGQLWFNSDTGGTYVYYDSAWVEVGAAPVNTILQTIDAKGDLLVGTADNTLARQAIGSNSQLLRANSSTATGVEWFTPPYAPAASPTFTGTVVLPSDTSIGNVSATEIGYVDGVTSAIQTQMDTKAPLAAPTFTGTVTLPSTTSIGNVSSTEIGYVDGVTSAIQTQLDSKLTAATAYTSGRNVLINGDFKIWQRGTAVQYNSGQGAYAADRWCGSHQYQNSRTQRTSISSPPSGLLAQYALRSSSSTTAQSGAGTRMRIAQKIDSLDSYRLRGQQVTLSFWIRFSGTTLSSIANSGNSSYLDFYYSVGSYTSTTDAATNTSAADAAFSGTLVNGSLPTSWTKYTLTGTVSSTANNVDVLFSFVGLGSTTSADTAWFELAQVQLEAGSVATPFEFEEYGTTLTKCHRYYWRQNSEVTGFAQRIGGTGSIYGGNTFVGVFNMPVTMRTRPTGSLEYSGLMCTDDISFDSTGGTWTLSANYGSPRSVLIYGGSLTGASNVQYAKLGIQSGANNYMAISAEL